MPFNRRFRSYVNLSSTRGKIAALCKRYEFERMIDWVEANETRLPTLSGQMRATA